MLTSLPEWSKVHYVQLWGQVHVWWGRWLWFGVLWRFQFRTIRGLTKWVHILKKNNLKVAPSVGQVMNYQRFHNHERKTIKLGCSFCGKIFVTKEELKNHKWNEHKGKTYQYFKCEASNQTRIVIIWMLMIPFSIACWITLFLDVIDQ